MEINNRQSPSRLNGTNMKNTDKLWISSSKSFINELTQLFYLIREMVFGIVIYKTLFGCIKDAHCCCTLVLKTVTLSAISANIIYIFQDLSMFSFHVNGFHWKDSPYEHTQIS